MFGSFFYIFFVVFFSVKNTAKRLIGYRDLSVFLLHVSMHKHTQTHLNEFPTAMLFSLKPLDALSELLLIIIMFGVLVNGGKIARISLLCRFCFGEMNETNGSARFIFCLFVVFAGSA